MGKLAVEAQRAGTLFVLSPDDERFVLVNDENSPLYDDRLKLPPSEELALSLAREGQIQPGMVRKNGPLLEILDGRQRFRAMRIANKWIEAGDERVAFRAGQPLVFQFEVVKAEDEKEAIRKMIAANLRIEDTPMVRARRIARALKWGLTKEEIRINYGFKSTKTLDNILALLDCSKAVQDAADRGELTETHARDIANLERSEQEELLAEMRAKGVMRGSGASRAIAEKKEGKEVSGAKTGKRMLTRHFLENYLAELEDHKAVGATVVRQHLRLFLGAKDALAAHEMVPYREAVRRAQRR